MIKFDVKNRFTGKVQFSAQIEANDDTSTSIKLGLAVRWGYAEGADLKGAYLKGADLKGADLKGAYLKGAYLKGAYLKGADLKGAYLKGADLKGAYLKGAYLKGADLEGADLKGADLKGAYLKGAYLKGAYLKGAYLKGADLEVPKIEKIHQAVYEAANKPGCFDMSTWHSCDTTHCRAGWVVHLAGEKGYKLEEQMGTPVAAYLIYRESDPTMRGMPDFYCGNDDALADMKERAEKEAKAA